MNLDVLHEAKLEPGQTPESLALETAVSFLSSRNQPRWEQRYKSLGTRERRGFLGAKKRFHCLTCGTDGVTAYDLLVQDKEMSKDEWVPKGKSRAFKIEDLCSFGVSTHCYDFFVAFCEGCQEARVVIHVSRATWD